jgi:hypothetical protein
LPHVASNVQVASSNTISPSSSSNLESKRNGKELVEFVEPLEKKPWRSYEKTRVFQDMRACHFPWAEVVVGEDGLVAHVQCKICNNIEGKPKLLTPKLDTFYKHVGRHKATIPSFNIGSKIISIARMLHMPRMRGFILCITQNLSWP